MSETTVNAGPPDVSAYAPSNSGPAETSQTAPATNTPGAEPVGEAKPDGGGKNPAWSKMLEKLPTEFHSIIEPDLREWDQNFSTKTQEVQSRYEPYSFLIDDHVDPENVKSALQITALIEADPQKFHEQMGEFYKDQWGQGQEVSQGTPPAEPEFSLDGEENPEFDITQHPKFQELSKNQEALAQYLAQEIEAKKQAEADREIEAEETRLKDKYGEYNQKFVYSYAVQNEVTLEEAVKEYHDMVKEIKSAPRASDSAPGVFAPSGGVPSSNPNPGKLSDKETRQLVAEMAARANQG